MTSSDYDTDILIQQANLLQLKVAEAAAELAKFTEELRRVLSTLEDPDER
jgi:hypothetical protein